MHIRSLIPATAFLCASSSAALAADPIDPDRFREPVVEAATFDWTGLYVGAHAGALRPNFGAPVAGVFRLLL
ncbi:MULTISPECIES: hypothetical protein [Roseibium]|uniref:hypothetical protein n=1 Tax=Alphaproteobacteria TaxID=28211 RepID=UPI00327964FE